MNSKIVTEKALLAIAADLKKQNRVLVAINGSFDLLHSGHVGILSEARRQGDVLAVLLNSDRSVRSYKGPTRPINDQRERAAMLAALQTVDYVCTFDELTPKRILASLQPPVYCNGSDWGKYCVERETISAYGGRIHIIRKKAGFSTSALIAKIIEVESSPRPKAVFLDRDGTINLNKGGYIHEIADFEFTPNAVKALKQLSATDFKIIIVTNQSGIGRGFYRQEDYSKLTDWMKKRFKKEGIRLDGVYHCPHVQEDGCDCRKPGVGMLLQSVADHGISLNDSWLIGDDDRDVAMGREANLRTIKIGRRSKGALQPNRFAGDLLEAVRIILER